MKAAGHPAAADRVRGRGDAGRRAAGLRPLPRSRPARSRRCSSPARAATGGGWSIATRWRRVQAHRDRRPAERQVLELARQGIARRLPARLRPRRHADRRRRVRAHRRRTAVREAGGAGPRRLPRIVPRAGGPRRPHLGPLHEVASRRRWCGSILQRFEAMRATDSCSGETRGSANSHPRSRIHFLYDPPRFPPRRGRVAGPPGRRLLRSTPTARSTCWSRPRRSGVEPRRLPRTGADRLHLRRPVPHTRRSSAPPRPRSRRSIDAEREGLSRRRGRRPAARRRWSALQLRGRDPRGQAARRRAEDRTCRTTRSSTTPAASPRPRTPSSKTVDRRRADDVPFGTDLLFACDRDRRASSSASRSAKTCGCRSRRVRCRRSRARPCSSTCPPATKSSARPATAGSSSRASRAAASPATSTRRAASANRRPTSSSAGTA